MRFSIGQIATAAAVNVQTIRYYERRGLLLPSERSSSGYRQYDQDSLLRLRFITHAQALGFSLNEVEELLSLRVRHGSACQAVERRTRAKIDVIDRRLRELDRLRRTLKRLVGRCRARKRTSECPVLEALEEESDEPQ
jgi:Hg(II)-responsive transcriptional regulator